MADSWRLKLDRAEKHLREFQIALGEYVQKHPYEAVRIVSGPSCSKHQGLDCGGAYSLRITDQPDPDLAVVVGDVIHNVRSALDHLAVALVRPSRRRWKASFPIETQRIWAKQGRRYVVPNPEPRRRWRTAVEGMPTNAVAFIEGVQPYRDPAPEQTGLAILSRLENADKHRQLTVLTVGLTKVTIWGTARGRTKELQLERPDTFVVEDGTELVHFAGGGGGSRLRHSEVQVEIRGSPLVTMKVADPDRRRGQLGEYWPLSQFLDGLIASIRGQVFPALEPYVRRTA